MDAKTVANYMLYVFSDAFDDLSNMKINKLLYYAQGYFAAKYGKPLFSDEIEAWEYGPVVPSVYQMFKGYGDKPISPPDKFDCSVMDERAKDLIFDIGRNYGDYSAKTLMRMTHVINSPWDKAYKRNKRNDIIPIDVIQSYSEELGTLPPATRKFKDEDFIGYRDKDGILVLPKEWDDERSLQ